MNKEIIKKYFNKIVKIIDTLKLSQIILVSLIILPIKLIYDNHNIVLYNYVADPSQFGTYEEKVIIYPNTCTLTIRQVRSSSDATMTSKCEAFASGYESYDIKRKVSVYYFPHYQNVGRIRVYYYPESQNQQWRMEGYF
jgi:hypothetical protein